MSNVNSTIFVFGGFSPLQPGGLSSNLLWAIDTKAQSPTWTSYNYAGAPSARGDLGMTTVGSVIWVFGGSGSPRPENQNVFGFDNKVYSVDTSLPYPAWISWSSLGTTPLPRYGHGMIAWGSTIYVFGGYSPYATAAYLNDLYALNTEESTPRWYLLPAGSPPSRRSYFGFAAMGQSIWVFGGASGGLQSSSDSFRLDLAGPSLVWEYGTTPSFWSSADTNRPGGSRNGMVSSGQTLFAYSAGKLWYLDCGPGWYRSYPGQGRAWAAIENCLQCSSGKFSSSVGASICMACGLGTFSASAASACTLCDLGTYSSSTGAVSVNTCLPCGAGIYTSATGAYICRSCEAGKFKSMQGIFGCSLCSTGTFSLSIGETSKDACKPCDLGRYSPEQGASSKDACLLCGVGTYSSMVGMSVCKQCGASTYSTALGASSDATCIQCARGSFTATPMASACVQCTAGTFSSNSGGTVCLLCYAGTYSSSLGESTNVSCTYCRAGTYSSALGASSNSKCKWCGAGTYSTLIGATSKVDCIPCQTGTRHALLGATSSSLCAGCAVGTYLIAGYQECMKCVAGTYSTSIGLTSNSSCISCISKCDSGEYLCPPGSTFDSCSSCPSSTFQPRNGSSVTACTSCFLEIQPQCESGQILSCNPRNGNISCGASLSWVQLSPVGQKPSARIRHLMASVGNVVYLFGGFAESNGQPQSQSYMYINDLWRLNTDNLKNQLSLTWEQLSPIGPAPKSGCGMCSIGTTIFLLDGESCGFELWALDTSVGSGILEWKRPEYSAAPADYQAYGMVSTGTMLVLFLQPFRSRQGIGNRLISVDTAAPSPSWTFVNLTDNPPYSRDTTESARQQTFGVAAEGHVVYLLTSTMITHVLRMDLFPLHWVQLSAANLPNTRQWGGFAAFGQALWVYGGETSDCSRGYYNPPSDLYKLDTRSSFLFWQNATPVHANGNLQGRLIYGGMIVVRDSLLVFGGGNGGLHRRAIVLYDDLWHLACGAGSYSFVSWAVDCFACGAGTYSSSIASILPTSAECTPCKSRCRAGEYLCPPGSASDSCGGCPAGTYQPESMMQIVSCVSCYPETLSSNCPRGQVHYCSPVTGDGMCLLEWVKLIHVEVDAAEATGELIPPARYYHAMAAVSDVAYVFGGCNNHNIFGDLWSVNLSMPALSWRQITAGFVSLKDGPEPRYFHFMCTVGNTVFLFGGHGKANKYFNDLWALNTDNATWTLILDNGPEMPFESFGPGYGMTAVGESLWYIEHFNTDTLRLFSLNTTQVAPAWVYRQVQSKFTIPTCFSLQGLTTIGNIVYILGKCPSNSPNNLYALQTETQEPLLTMLTAASPNLPPVMYFGFAAQNQSLWLFGGHVDDPTGPCSKPSSNYRNFFYKLDTTLAKLAWQNVTPQSAGPSPRTSILVAAGPNLLVFGGLDGIAAHNDLWLVRVEGADFLMPLANKSTFSSLTGLAVSSTKTSANFFAATTATGTPLGPGLAAQEPANVSASEAQFSTNQSLLQVTLAPVRDKVKVTMSVRMVGEAVSMFKLLNSYKFFEGAVLQAVHGASMVIVTNITYLGENGRAQNSYKMEDSRSLFTSLNALNSSSIKISISLRRKLVFVDIVFEIYFISKSLAEQAIVSDLTQSHLSHQLEEAGMGPISVIGTPVISFPDDPSPAQSTDSTQLVVIVALSVGLPAAILALGIQVLICRRCFFSCFARKAVNTVNTGPHGANSQGP
jgi:hypothetical protein